MTPFSAKRTCYLVGVLISASDFMCVHMERITRLGSILETVEIRSKGDGRAQTAQSVNLNHIQTDKILLLSNQLGPPCSVWETSMILTVEKPFHLSLLKHKKSVS